MVCFTETPLEHVWMMTEDVGNRQIRFAPYGPVFKKQPPGRKDATVWYLDITPGHDWLTNYVTALVSSAFEVARDSLTNAVDVPALSQRTFLRRLTPFIEQMSPMNNGRRKEFWWERKWASPEPLQLFGARRGRRLRTRRRPPNNSRSPGQTHAVLE